jgi:hypothetical protein
VGGGNFGAGGGIYNVGTATINASTISGNSHDWPGGGISNGSGTVTINASNISGNSALDSIYPYGGGIFNCGTMTIDASVTNGNSARYGAGIYSLGRVFYDEDGQIISIEYATMTISGSSISGNQGGGGGIDNGYAGTVMITASTISGNSAYGYMGGGIYNAGTLTVVDTTITGNSAGGGGGIDNGGTATINNSNIIGNSGYMWGGGGIDNGGTATINNSNIIGNSGYAGGGGIGNGGTLTINASSISGNEAWGGRYGTYGGGISNGGTAMINNSTISGNSANAGNGCHGGGIANTGTMAIAASSISGNSVDRYGCGSCYNSGGIYTAGIVQYDDEGEIIYIRYATMTIDASTVNNNSAAYGGGIFDGGAGTVTIHASTISGNSANGSGGGIDNRGTMRVNSSTVSGNAAQGYDVVNGSLVAGTGGGIDSPSTTTLLMSIVAGNTGGDAAGGFDSLGYNLIGNTGGSSGWVGTDLLNKSPKLGPLQYNGGPTMTMALLPGSPAIDAGSNDLIPAGVQNDQRGPGFQRIVNATGKPTATVDIGAFEWQPYVSSFAVAWGNQKYTLKTAADGVRILPAGRKADVPWLGLKTLSIGLSTAERLTPLDVSVTGSSGINYGPVTLSGSGTDYTITLKEPISQLDRVMITINLGGMVTSTHELDVVPGDVNDDGVVSASDVVLIRNAILKTGDPLMIGWCDLDGNGAVDMTDFSLARKRLGTHLH